jgi:hypothetical protein
MQSAELEFLMKAYGSFVRWKIGRQCRQNQTNFALGLCGELSELVFELGIDGNSAETVLEVGDVIFYVFAIALQNEIDVRELMGEVYGELSLLECFCAAGRIAEQVKHEEFFGMCIKRDELVRDLKIVFSAIGMGCNSEVSSIFKRLDLGAILVQNMNKILTKGTGHD